MYKLTRVATAFLLCLPMTASAFVCNVTTTPVAFSTYDVFSPIPADSTGSIMVSCNNPEKKAFSMNIAISTGNAGVFTPRQMRTLAGTDPMIYNLFTDPSRTVIWGDGTGSTSVVTEVVTRDTALQETIYARIPPQQNLKVGTYTDTLTVTLSW